MAGSPKRRAKRELQQAIAAGLVEPPKRARTRPVTMDADGTCNGHEKATAATSPDARAHAAAAVRPLPSGLTEEQFDSILAALSCGVPLEAACASVRVPRSTMYDWMKADPEFRAIIDDARDAWSRAHVEYVAQAADWKARTWLLERRLPKEYAAMTKHAGHDGGALLADAELLELARRALGVAPPDGDAGED